VELVVLAELIVLVELIVSVEFVVISLIVSVVWIIVIRAVSGFGREGAALRVFGLILIQVGVLEDPVLFVTDMFVAVTFHVVYMFAIKASKTKVREKTIMIVRRMRMILIIKKMRMIKRVMRLILGTVMGWLVLEVVVRDINVEDSSWRVGQNRNSLGSKSR
jgi:hypothetical protein